MTKPWVVPCKAIVYSGGPMHGFADNFATKAPLWGRQRIFLLNRHDEQPDREHRYRRVWVSRDLVAHYSTRGSG